MTTLLIFFVLNFTLFIPRYYLNKSTSSFFPFKEIFENNIFNIKKIFNRFNDDIFRFNLEFSFVVILLHFIKTYLPIIFTEIFVSIFYLLTLLLFFYHYSILSIYKSYPAFYTDWKLIKQGFQILKNGYVFQLFLGIAFFLLFSILIVYLNVYLVKEIYASDKILLLIFCTLIVLLTLIFSFLKKVNFFIFRKEFDFHYISYFSFQSSISLLASNRFFSKKTKEDMKKLPNIISKNIVSLPKNIEFKSKPNIYFIAIESYGAILYENENFEKNYTTLLDSISKNLNNQNWHIASSLSRSPVSGGSSWISYSSFLKGIDINSDLMYRKLLHKRNEFPTQSILNILEDLGYSTNLISGIGGYKNFKINWEEILSFLGTKNLIRYDDLEYNGVTFNFGPSAPDQYMLNKSLELLKEKNHNQPITFFVETINSHANFETPTVIFNDWKKCNKVKKEEFKPTTELEKKLIENYFLAIKYQLKVIEDLILNEKEDSIFILFGDHQPPLITSSSNSFNTPVHIISKNKKFVNSWLNSGFSDSLNCKNNDAKLNHYDLKPIFIKTFIEIFKK
jgi:hypothetical protein